MSSIAKSLPVIPILESYNAMFTQLFEGINSIIYSPQPKAGSGAIKLALIGLEL